MHWIMRKINRISRSQGRYLTKALKDLGVGTCHHSYFLVISRKPGISQEELAREISVDKSNVTRTLANLEQQGFVKRCSSPQDRRVLQVYPTEKMEAAVPRVREAVRDWNAYLTADLTDEEMEQFQNTLDHILERAQKYSEGREAETR